MLEIKEKQFLDLKKILFHQLNDEIVSYFLRNFSDYPLFESIEEFSLWLKNRLEYAFEWELLDANCICDFIRYSIEFEEIQSLSLNENIKEIMTYPGRTDEKKIQALFLYLTKIYN